MKYRWLFILILLTSTGALGFTINHQISVTILDVSSSRKTILINKGADNKLINDTYVKIYDVHKGLVGYAVSVRISPNRSVWSVYKIVQQHYLFNSKKVTFQVINKVALTNDGTKAHLRRKKLYNLVSPELFQPSSFGFKPQQTREVIANNNLFMAKDISNNKKKINIAPILLVSGKEQGVDWSLLDEVEITKHKVHGDFSILDKE